MKIFEIIEDHFASVGLTAAQSLQPNLFNIKNMATLAVFGLNILLTGAYIVFTANDFEEYVDSLFGCSTVLNFFIAFGNLILQMPRLFKFIVKLKHTIDKRLPNPTSKVIYSEIDEKLQKWFRILNIVMVGITPIAVTFPMFAAGIFAYYFTDLGNDAFVLPFPIWLPFDSQNPIGYSITIALLYMFIFNASFAAISIIVFAIGISLMLISLTQDIIKDLEWLNESSRRIKKSPVQIVKQFIRQIRIHSKSMQLARDFSELSKMMCTILFGWGILAICGTMLMLQMELRQIDKNPMFILVLISEMFWSVIAVFTACEFGERLGNAYFKIDLEICKLEWYRFPMKLWSLLPIVMIASQEPIELHAIGSVSCRRIIFKNVVNSGYSNFMVLRRFDI